jgi:hypothetical protein
MPPESLIGLLVSLELKQNLVQNTHNRKIDLPETFT